MRRHTSSQRLMVRKRVVSVSELEDDTVVGAMARLEEKRRFQHQAKSAVRETLEDQFSDFERDLPEKTASRLRFSKAPHREKPIQSLGSTVRVKPMRVSFSTRRFLHKGFRRTSPKSSQKWISPLSLRGVSVLPNANVSRPSLLVSPGTAHGSSRQRLWTGAQRWWEGDLPLAGLLRRKVLKNLSATESINSH
jgi:hypothetical protein